MAEPNVRYSATRLPGAPDDEHETVERVMADVITFEDGIGKDWRDTLIRRYWQYRGFRKFADAWTKAGPNDRDAVIYDAKKHWGAHLHIPLSYRTIETLVPSAIANRPRLLYMPRQEKWAENVQHVKLLVDSQQDNIDIDLPFQAVMRSGHTYGLGVGYTYWKKDYAPRRRVKRRMLGKGWTPSRLEMECIFDDPLFEDVDLFDFGWDPYGSDMKTTGWAYHRAWLSTGMVLNRVKSGAWTTQSAQLLDEDVIRGLSGSGQKYDEIWQERMLASGFSSFHMSSRGEQPHELIEWHDGFQVFAVLDRQVLVVNGESPMVGMKPYDVYRPTPLQRQMVGIGDLEPIEHLQRELDTIRSQRRDAATIALAPGFIYDDSAVDEDDLVFGPASAIPVNNARVSDAIMPIPVRDVPASGYQEEQVVRQDFDLVVGINDRVDQPGGVAGTATEAQLVQASLSRRIELKARRFELEIVRGVARKFLALDQRMILEKRNPIRAPDEGMDMVQAASEGRWQWFDIDPGALQGEFEVIPEGGSMAARNVPQDRQDAMQIMQLFAQNPFIDQRRPLLRALKLFGIDDPESWLAQEDPPIPRQAIETLKQMGVDPELVDFAVAQAQQVSPQLPPEAQDEQQGPQTADVAQMMGQAA